MKLKQVGVETVSFHPEVLNAHEELKVGDLAFQVVQVVPHVLFEDAALRENSLHNPLCLPWCRKLLHALPHGAFYPLA